MKKSQQLLYCIMAGQRLLVLLFILLGAGAAMAQSPVKGVVKDKDGKPLAGATVTIKGKNLSTITSADGGFTITAGRGDLLVVSYVGYQNHELKVFPGAEMNIQLSAKTDPLDDVVVVAYGAQRKKDITGSVSVVNVADAKKTATYDVAKMLQGQVAGVEVQGSGEPGGYVNIKIRGVNSLISNGPLFVVDGVALYDAPFDFSTADIESVQVLKDASSAALYGVRAAGGVVIITTKKGRSGPLRVNYTGSYGFQRIGKKIPVTDRVGYQKITTAAELNAGLGIAPGNDPSSPKFIGNINTDWQKEAFKTGRIQDHNVSLSGGSELASFNVSLGYFDQTGTLKGPQKYDRYTVNMNMQGKKGIFSYGAKVALTQSDKNSFGISTDHAVFGGIVTNTLTAIPTMPVYDSTRLGGYGGVDNVTQRAISLNVIGMNNLVTDNDKRNRSFFSFWGEAELLKNLKYKINVAYDKTNFRHFHYEPKYDLGFYYLNTQYNMQQRNGTENYATVENTLTYQLKRGKHKVDFLAGTSYINKTYEDIYATAKGTQDLGQFINFSYITNPADKAVFSYNDVANLLSYFGRINYNYGDRYMLTGNIRRDGSSKFGPSYRFGNFSSVAAAWNVANESFIHLPKAVSSLKLRAGYGVLGNENGLSPYPYVAYLNTSASYDFNGVLAPGATAVTQADPNLHWETTTTFNAAVDLGLFNNSLLFTAEYFNRKSTDLQANIPIPLSVGSVPSTITTNAASTRNTGLEFSATYAKSAGAFKYNINANVSTLANKVLKLGGTNNPIFGSGSKTEVGRSIGELYGFITEGIFQNAADVSSHATQTNAAPGDVKFKDVNGLGSNGKPTGKPDGTITDDDRVYLGRTIPNLYYGFNASASYKDFDISFFFQGSGGNKVFNGVYQALMAGQYGNSSVDELNYWTPTNTKTNIPRPIIGDPNQNGRFSDRFVQNGSYLKLQNAQVGYTLPEGVFGRMHAIKSLRVYISGQNLFILSGYKGYDPDFISDGLFSRGFDYGSFPNPRTIMFGLQLGL